MVRNIFHFLCIFTLFFMISCDGLNDLFDENLPEIDGGLKVSKEKLYPLDTLTASVDATNPIDGDLTYEWNRSGGIFLVQSDPSTIKWIAPSSSGKYTLTVKVTNDNGTSDASKEVEVLLPQVPVLNGGIGLSATNVTALDTVIATISATNPRTGPLSYTWTCSKGRYLYPVDKDTIRWIAPLSGGESTLTVEVSNSLSSVQTSRKINVYSSTSPIVHITDPANGSQYYLGDKIKITAEAAHENGITFVRLMVISSGGQDSLIQTLGTSADGIYRFSLFTLYKDLVGHSTIKVEAEAANPGKTKSSDQITIDVLGIHVGKQ